MHNDKLVCNTRQSKPRLVEDLRLLRWFSSDTERVPADEPIGGTLTHASGLDQVTPHRRSETNASENTDFFDVMGF